MRQPGRTLKLTAATPCGESRSPTTRKRSSRSAADPTVDAVADDEVEFAVRRVDFVEAAGVQRDIRQAETRDARGPRRDLRRREIDADEARLRQRGGERNEMAAGGAADLQHPRGSRGRRAEPEPAGVGRHARGLEADERRGTIRRFVVAAARARQRGGERLGVGRSGVGVGHRRAFSAGGAADRVAGILSEAPSTRHGAAQRRRKSRLILGDCGQSVIGS